MAVGDLLALVQEAGATLLVDFKSAGDQAREARVLADALAPVTRPELILVSSFSVPFLCCFAELSPGFPLYPIVSLRRNFPRPADLDRWAGASVLAAAAVVNPFLPRALRRNGQELVVWFGSTEWPAVVRGAVRAGARALIVARVKATVERLGPRS